MASYVFRSDSDGRQVPKFGVEEWKTLESILGIKLEEYSFGSSDYKAAGPSELGSFFKCTSGQCFFFLRTKDQKVQVNLGMLMDSSSLVIRVDQRIELTAKRIEDLRQELFKYFEKIKSVSIIDENSVNQSIMRDKSIPKPKYEFGSGTEWYMYMAPQNWENYYEEETILNAPSRVKLLKNRFIEWYLYGDLLEFDPELAEKNRRYFGLQIKAQLS